MIRDLVVSRDADELVDALHEAGLYDPTVLKAIFITGLGGAGKGRIGQAMFAGRGLRYINQDRHLERLFKEQGVPLSKVSSRYDLFKQAQGLARKERAQAMQTRQGLLVDSTGWDYERISKPVKRLRKLGYDCYMVLVKTSLEIAWDRNKARGAAGGREVARHDIERTLRGLKRSVPKYRKLFGPRNMVVIENDATVSDDQWTQLAPQLTRVGDKFLARPIRNPIGRRWIADQLGMVQKTDPAVAKVGDRLLGKRHESLRVSLPPDPFS